MISSNCQLKSKPLKNKSVPELIPYMVKGSWYQLIKHSLTSPRYFAATFPSAELSWVIDPGTVTKNRLHCLMMVYSHATDLDTPALAHFLCHDNHTNLRTSTCVYCLHIGTTMNHLRPSNYRGTLTEGASFHESLTPVLTRGPFVSLANTLWSLSRLTTAKWMEACIHIGERANIVL